MRKTTIGFLITLISFASHAQTMNPQEAGTSRAVDPNLSEKISRHLDRKKTVSQKTSSTSESFWLCYGETQNQVIGGTAKTWWNYLFPDSNVNGCIAGCYNPWIHNLGNVLDPFAPDFISNDGINWNANNTYTVDSMEIVYFYLRNHPNTSLADTLIVTLYTNATAGDLPTYYFAGSWVSNSYGVDTLRYKQMLYDYTTNSPQVTGTKQVYKIPLTASDTAWYYFGAKAFSTNSFAVPAGKRLVASSVVFKPGYTYAPGDTIDGSNKNSFMFVSYEMNGNNTFPTYIQGDWNVSEIIRKQERYNANPGTNGFYLPSYWFVDAYKHEHHLLSYKITSNNVGLAEGRDAVNGVKLNQNYPNPAATSTRISYELEKAAEVTIEISDITGRVLSRMNKGHQQAGKHAADLDVSSFPQGIYFYTLKTGAVSLTRRMIISE